MTFGPYKCPDCGAWWAGLEHRCPPVVTQTGTAFRVGHCHGCSTALCSRPDHVPCQLHAGGWSVT